MSNANNEVKEVPRLDFGFIGTRRPLTPIQLERIRKILAILVTKTTMHVSNGSAADYQMMTLAKKLNMDIIVHPCEDKPVPEGTELRAVKPIMACYEDIIAECTDILAAVYKRSDRLNGITHDAVRKARRKPECRIVMVDGRGSARVVQCLS